MWNAIKNISKVIASGLVILLVQCCQTSIDESNYYFDNIEGQNTNHGHTKDKPLQSLSLIKTLDLQPGDTIFIKNGQTFPDAVVIREKYGTKAAPIVITSYTKSNIDKPYIKTAGPLESVLIVNSSYIEVNNLEISSKGDSIRHKTKDKIIRHGVLVKSTKPLEFQGIQLRNLDIHDVFYEQKGFVRPKKEVKTENGTQNYGGGIRFLVAHKQSKFSNIVIDSCEISNVSHTGIKLTSLRKYKDYGIDHFTISNNVVFKTGGPGIQMSGVQNGHIFNNTVNYSGSNDDSRKWGRGSGLWTWNSDRVLIEKNAFKNANGPGDSAGAHIDFNCSNIVLQYNLSANNAGGFCEILGNNYNCAYRYNISYNDGYRVKGKNGAFQEGKTLWLSGYTGKKRKRNGPFNSYIYNNTIIVEDHLEPKMAFNNNAKGVLIANNIFHIGGQTKIVKGDQYRPQKKGKLFISEVVFKNNLFLTMDSWPKDFLLQDENPLYGDAIFEDVSDKYLTSFIPKNTSLIKDKGILISKIPKDSIGLVYSLTMKSDILGNPIINAPDLGAIELK